MPKKIGIFILNTIDFECYNSKTTLYIYINILKAYLVMI